MFNFFARKLRMKVVGWCIEPVGSLKFSYTFQPIFLSFQWRTAFQRDFTEGVICVPFGSNKKSCRWSNIHPKTEFLLQHIKHKSVFVASPNPNYHHYLLSIQTFDCTLCDDAHHRKEWVTLTFTLCNDARHSKEWEQQLNILFGLTLVNWKPAVF